MKKAMILMLSLMMLSGSAMAQESQPNGQDTKVMRPKRVRMTQEQMTEKMVSELKLDKKQTKKVTKLNKKFKTLIEGEQQDNMKGQRPPMGQGRPDGYREGGRPSGSGFGGGMPGGGMGGPGSRQKDIKYTGATTLTATITNAAGDTVSTETGRVDVTLGDNCTWILTADTYVTSFTGDASRIKSNGHRLYVNGKDMSIR